MKALLFVIFSSIFLTLTACEHTAQGFGQDMEHAGKSIQKAVNS